MVTARDREADLIGHVRTHETCTPECDDFRRLLGKVDGAARVREQVEAVTADLWRQTPCGCGHRADLHTMGGDGMAVCVGGLMLCKCTWSFPRIVAARLNAALTDETAP